jgi:hypothetical protein
MRMYQGILLVVFLTIAMVAAGVAWEHYYVSPQIEAAQAHPDSRSLISDELPADCLEELTRTEMAPKVAETAVAAQSAVGGPSLINVETVGRQAAWPNQVATHVEVADSPPSLLPGDAAARPVQKVQSADYTETVGQSTAGSRRQPTNSAANLVQPKGPQDKLKSVDALDLMRRLRADDADQQAEARRELVRRGFSEVDLQLARQLFSPDVETRKQLARTVPRLSSVDAAQWLMWLAQDPEPDVRLVAISMLATTGDPALLDRVEAMARNDHDPQIKALEEQIRKQRDLESSRGGAIDANPIR